MLEMAAASAGIPAVGYFAQIPHYVSGAVRARRGRAAAHAGAAPRRRAAARRPRRGGRQLRTRLDAAVAADETTRAYVERLEAMVDE